MNKSFKKDKQGVFGLSSVQMFFGVILGLTILSFVIIIIMGTLSGTTILSQLSGSVVNETGAYSNVTGYTVDQASLDGFGGAVLTAVYNWTDGTAVGLGNLSLTSAGVLTNASVTNYANLSISYTYNYNSVQQTGLNSILTNTSTGITSFFSAINPVYAILAVLVIILVLVVLVRIVKRPQEGVAPQL
jgi:uncharacterized membrane protein